MAKRAYFTTFTAEVTKIEGDCRSLSNCVCNLISMNRRNLLALSTCADAILHDRPHPPHSPFLFSVDEVYQVAPQKLDVDQI